jgi:DNA repair ATPase RecN
LFTDEIDGGSISGPDADALVSMIKSKAWDDVISIYVISHRPEFDGRCDRNLVIRKDGGFSTLIEQPDE